MFDVVDHRHRQVKLVLVGAILLLNACLAKAQVRVQPWKDNPYRNFLGSWSGTIEGVKNGVLTVLNLTIVEEPEKARMRWNYVFGRKGQKDFDQETKYIVMAPGLSKLVMGYEDSDKELFAVPGLSEFAKKGFGRLTASYEVDNRNYWHVKKHTTEEVTFDLEAETLTYVRERTRGGVKNVVTIVKLSKLHSASETPTGAVPQ